MTQTTSNIFYIDHPPHYIQQKYKKMYSQNQQIQQLFQNLNCPMCYSEYDSTTHFPMLVCPSLHLTCKRCTEQMILLDRSAERKYCTECHAVIGKGTVSRFQYGRILEKMKGILDVQCYQSKCSVLQIYLDEQDQKIKKLHQQNETKTTKIKHLQQQITQLQTQLQSCNKQLHTLKSTNHNIKHNPQQQNQQQQLHGIQSYISEIVEIKQQQQQVIRQKNYQEKVEVDRNFIQSIVDMSGQQHVQMHEALNLEEVGFERIEDALITFGDLTKLKALSLRNSNLNKLPQNIDKMKNLVYLQLDTNQLQQLPQNFCNLTELVFLHIYNNKLTCLPQNIHKLINLSQLFASYNNLKTLPPSFSKLNLAVLSLQSNPLTQFPQHFSSLVYLQYLQFSLFNKNAILKSLHIRKMKNMRKLVIWFYGEFGQEDQVKKFVQDCVERKIVLEIGEEYGRLR